QTLHAGLASLPGAMAGRRGLSSGEDACSGRLEWRVHVRCALPDPPGTRAGPEAVRDQPIFLNVVVLPRRSILLPDLRNAARSASICSRVIEACLAPDLLALRSVMLLLFAAIRTVTPCKSSLNCSEGNVKRMFRGARGGPWTRLPGASRCSVPGRQTTKGHLQRWPKSLFHMVGGAGVEPATLAV